MTTPADISLEILQGSSFQYTLLYAYDSSPPVPIDLTGVTARMHIREGIDSDEILCNLTTENSKIVIDGPLGSILLTLEATETETFQWVAGVYDLELVWPSGFVMRLCQGSVMVSPEVTRG